MKDTEACGIHTCWLALAVLVPACSRTQKNTEENLVAIGTPPPSDTWHTFPDDTWHAFLSGLTPSGFPPKVHVVRFSYSDSLRERHTTLTNITSGRPPYHIRTTDISYPDMFVRIIDRSKQVLHVITTACHGPRSATCRVKGQEWNDDKSPPTISNNRDASHDLCQPPVGWWWPCHSLEASWQAKISPYH